jgi:hypothetical protein
MPVPRQRPSRRLIPYRRSRSVPPKSIDRPRAPTTVKAGRPEGPTTFAPEATPAVSAPFMPSASLDEVSAFRTIPQPEASGPMSARPQMRATRNHDNQLARLALSRMCPPRIRRRAGTSYRLHPRGMAIACGKDRRWPVLTWRWPALIVFRSIEGGRARSALPQSGRSADRGDRPRLERAPGRAKAYLYDPSDDNKRPRCS